MPAAVLMKTPDMRAGEKEALCSVSCIIHNQLPFLFLLRRLESQIRGVVSSIPQSLRIPRTHLKMSNTSIGQGKHSCASVLCA